MKRITQKEIANCLGCEIATSSRYLSNKRDIKLKDALKVSNEFKVPVEIFTCKETQVKYFGRTYIKEIV